MQALGAAGGRPLREALQARSLNGRHPYWPHPKAVAHDWNPTGDHLYRTLSWYWMSTSGSRGMQHFCTIHTGRPEAAMMRARSMCADG